MVAKLTYLSLLVLSFLVSSSAVSFAQLGEQAGQPTLNVALGGSATFNYSILNSGSSPINFTVILPTLNTIPHNATPTVSVKPMSGTLAPHSQQLISITVSMPSSDKVGLTWQGVLQVVEATPSSASSSGGASAVITAGVAKILTIHSVAPKGWPILYFVIIAIVIAVAAGSAGYYLVFIRRKAVAARAVAEVRRARAKRAVVAMKKPRPAARKAGKKAARKPARKRTAAKKARQRKPASAARARRRARR